MTEGWKCPNCGKAHGPHVDTCPYMDGGSVEITYVPYMAHPPTYPGQVVYPSTAPIVTWPTNYPWTVSSTLSND